LYPEQAVLLRDGASVGLTGKSVALLSALVRQAGTALSADELIALVWPGRVIDEGNIRVHINRLRKALDDAAQERSWIQTVPMRGYAFAGSVQRLVGQGAEIAPQPVDGAPSAATAATSLPLPLPLAPLYGRESDMAELERQLRLQRLVSVVGAGGVGKTALALAAARASARLSAQQIVYVDLALVEAAAENGPDGVHRILPAIAAACGFPASLAPVTMAALSGWLTGRPTLLLLDHCGCLIDSAAACSAALLGGTPALRILAASREPLRVQGEWVCRIAPLALAPPPRADAPALTAQEARAYPALRLFADLVSGHLGGYQLSDDDAPLAAALCRRLDGLPLAIELAAGMVGQVGLPALAAGVADSLALLARGRRSADPRHRSLRASLDWSFERLPRAEQRVLLSLSTFSADFTPACCGAAGGGGAEVAELIGNLVLKSWIEADTSAMLLRYRLSNVTRVYLRERAAAQAQAITPVGRVLAVASPRTSLRQEEAA
jgi:predicted ATPase/DNA-binding winged helix-turn-helix (wHTH) protein